MINPVINIFKSLDEAMYFENSQANRYYIFSGVQLLPNNPNKYLQVTNTPGGINLEDWTVWGVNMCDGVEQDITESFFVEKLTNSTNGNPQFIWSLTNVPIDFGWKMIYLKILNQVGEFFYSQPFRLTDLEKEKTSQFIYKEKASEDYQSIGFNAWFRNHKQYKDLTLYYRISDEKSVASAIKRNNVSRYEIEDMPFNRLIELSDVLSCPYCYIDGSRLNLYAAPKIPDPEFQENFGNFIFEATVDKSESFQIIQEENEVDFDSNDFDSNDFLT